MLGDRTGFQGHRYATTELGTKAFADDFGDYLGFLAPRLREAYRVLAPDGSFYFHTDYREVHYCKVLLDDLFGRQCFLNEIIWAYDFGGRGARRWPAKHDSILFYVKHPSRYVFNRSEIDRLPYMAPNLVGVRGEGGRGWRCLHRCVVRRRSSQRERARAHGIPHARSRSRFSSGSSPRRHVPETSCSTFSPAAARQATLPTSWADGSCSSKTTRTPSRSWPCASTA